MADRNQQASSGNNPQLNLPWDENSPMAKRMNKCIKQWERERDLAAKTKQDAITKIGSTSTLQNKTKEGQQ